MLAMDLSVVSPPAVSSRLTKAFTSMSLSRSPSISA